VKRGIRDPFNGISHMVGAGLAIVGLVVLMVLAQGKPLHLTAFAVYGGTLVLLYTSSALYHSLRVGPKVEGALYGLDRAAIYALIAGTYTPICLVALRGGWGWSLFGVVWGIAVVGIIVDIIAKQRTPDWLQALLYLIAGWLMLFALVPMGRVLPLPAMIWLFAGSLLYTVGAVICVKEKPHLIPGVFGAHELWHVMVIAASICHFIVMLFVARL